MSTENEEWRENSFNEENTGAGRDGNRSYNREEENVRIVLLTTVKVGIVRIARDLMPTMKGANAHSVRMVIALMATVRNVLLTIVKAVIVRIVLASITIVKVATVRNVLTTAKVVLMVIVLNALPTIVKAVIVRIVRDLIRILTAATVLSVLTTVKAANNALMVIVRIVPVSIVVKVATVLSVLLQPRRW